MADFVQTRTLTQCRTHHQKYETKFGDVKKIIEIYKKEIGPNIFSKIVKDFSKGGTMSEVSRHNLCETCPKDEF